MQLFFAKREKISILSIYTFVLLLFYQPDNTMQQKKTHISWKKTVLTSLLGVFLAFQLFFSWATFAKLEIIPEAKNPQELWTVVECVGGIGGPECQKWDLWDRYNKEEKKIDIWGWIASGLFSWDKLLEYLSYIIKFASQLGILIGTFMIIFTGYKYVMAAFWWKSNPGAWKIKDAIIGILIITFSYAIMRVLQAVSGIW